MQVRASERPPTSEQFVYHALRTDILAGLLEPGERLVQNIGNKRVLIVWA